MTDSERWLWNEWFNNLECCKKPAYHIRHLSIKDRLHHLRVSLLLNRLGSTRVILKSLDVPRHLSFKEQIAFVQLMDVEA